MRRLFFILWLPSLIAASVYGHGTEDHSKNKGAGSKQVQVLKTSQGVVEINLEFSPPKPRQGQDLAFKFKIERVLDVPDALLGRYTPVVDTGVEARFISSGGETAHKPLAAQAGEAGVYVLEQRFEEGGEHRVQLKVYDGEATFAFQVSVIPRNWLRIWGTLAVVFFGMFLVGQRYREYRGAGGRWGFVKESAGALAAIVGASAAMLAAMAYFLFPLGNPRVVEADTPVPQYAIEGGRLHLTLQQQKLLGIRTAKPERVRAAMEWRRPGTLMANPRRTAEVVAPLWGRVEYKDRVWRVGDYVKKGETLADVVLELSTLERYPLENRTVEMKETFERAKIAVALALREMERATELSASDPYFKKEAELRKQVYETALKHYQTARSQVAAQERTLRVRDPKHTLINSPISGTIAAVHFTPGDIDKNGEFMKLFTIIDGSELWLSVHVFQTDLRYLNRAQQVTFTVPGVPGRSFTGHLQSIGAYTDPANSSVLFIYNVPNADGALRAGMSADVTFKKDQAESALELARSALVSEGEPVIFVRLGPEEFAPQPVRVIREGDDRVSVSADIPEGAEVVVEGAYFLNALFKPAEGL